MASISQTAKSFLWVIGDTPRDVEAGKIAGAKTIAVATGGSDTETLRATEPDFLFDNLSDSPAFLSILDSVENNTLGT